MEDVIMTKSLAQDEILVDPAMHRSIAWKLLLGLISGCDPNNWVEQICIKRHEYSVMRDKLMTDPTKKQEQQQDLLLDNPLSVAEDSSWNKYFQDEELIAEINKDLERLTPLGEKPELFESDDTIQAMRSVLFVWSKQHPETKYRQGMHDLLGEVLYALSDSKKEIENSHELFAPAPALLKKAPKAGVTAKAETAATAEQATGDEATTAATNAGDSSLMEGEEEEEEEEDPWYKYKSCIAVLCDYEAVEADAYFIFSALMRFMHPLYMVDLKRNIIKEKKKAFKKPNRGLDLGGGELGTSAEDLIGTTKPKAKEEEQVEDVGGKKVLPVQALSIEVLQTILRRIDPELSTHLAQQQVPPEVFLLRWLRLALCREFLVEDTLSLWDGMIAATSAATECATSGSTSDEAKGLASDPLNPLSAAAESGAATDTPLALKGLCLLPHICAVLIWRKREQLLKADNTGCLQLLMRSDPPPLGTVPAILQVAKDIADPTRMADTQLPVQMEGWVVVRAGGGRVPGNASPQSYWRKEYLVLSGIWLRRYATFHHSIAHYNSREVRLLAVKPCSVYENALTVTLRKRNLSTTEAGVAANGGAWASGSDLPSTITTETTDEILVTLAYSSLEEQRTWLQVLLDAVSLGKTVDGDDDDKTAAADVPATLGAPPAEPMPPNGVRSIVDVVKFVDGPLGVVLKQPAAPRKGPLEVSGFKDEPGGRPGQALRAGVLSMGDQLEAVNGLDATHLTMRQLVGLIDGVGERPLYLAFRHQAEPEVDHVPGFNVNTLQGAAAGAAPPIPPVPGGETGEAGGRLGASLEPPPLLQGEVMFATVEAAIEEVHFMSFSSTIQKQYVPGMIFLTNYRCSFHAFIDAQNAADVAVETGGERSPVPPRWQIPMMMIESVRGQGAQRQGGNNGQGGGNQVLSVVVACKDGQERHLSFATPMVYMRLQQCLQALAFPGGIEHTFAFQHKMELPPPEQREYIYDPIRDYRRCGLLPPEGAEGEGGNSFNNGFPGGWRVYSNADFHLCSTYPQILMVPAVMTDDDIRDVAQPLVGLNSKRSSADEKLLRAIAEAGGTSKMLHIMDARGQLAAHGNRALGKGTEVMAHYPGMRLWHMDIANIHGARTALKKIFSLCGPCGVANNDNAYLAKVEQAGWLKEVRLIMQASVRMVQFIEVERASVLTHCSDGWDRTAQMSALGQLLMDPYYRTIDGFGHLVEKEWVSFGHQFFRRCGHGQQNAADDQRSPVLLLWLDCVWQLTQQHGEIYEFNGALLLAMADHLFSCRFGTWLTDCKKKKLECKVEEHTVSFWTYVQHNRELFTNPDYAPSDRSIYPNCNPKNIRLWEDYFLRWDSTIMPRRRPQVFY